MWKTFNKNIIPGLTQIPGLSTCKCLYAACTKGLKCLHSKPGAHAPASCVGGLQANPQSWPSCLKPRNMSKKTKWYRSMKLTMWNFIHPRLIVFVIAVPVTSFFNVGCFGSGIGLVFGGQISGIPQRWDSSLVGHIKKTGHVQQAGHDGVGGIGTTSEIKCLVLKLYGLNY